MAGSGVFPKSQKDKVYSADYNTIRGVALGVVETFYGNAMSSANVTKEKITSAQMGNLRYDINRAYKHITGSNGIGSALAAGNKIRATDWNGYKTTADYCETNKLSAHPTQLATTIYSTNLTSTWTSVHTWQTLYTWSSNAAATYFFNAGGYFEVDTSGSNGTGSPKDNQWLSLLNNAPTRTYTRNNWITNTDINKAYYGGGGPYYYYYGTDHIRTKIEKVSANQLRVTLILYASGGNVDVDAYGTVTEYCSVDAITEENSTQSTLINW